MQESKHGKLYLRKIGARGKVVLCLECGIRQINMVIGNAHDDIIVPGISCVNRT